METVENGVESSSISTEDKEPALVATCGHLEKAVSMTERPVLPPELFASGSENDNCPICLGPLQNRSVTNACFAHRFCFECLFEWAKINSSCPLCKAKFTSIYHSIKLRDEFETYHVPSRSGASLTGEESVADVLAIAGSSRFRYASTMTPDRLGFVRILQEFQRESRGSQIWELLPASDRSSWIFRRWLYETGRRAKYREGAEMNLREATPVYYRDHPGEQTRLLRWLHRELHAVIVVAGNTREMASIRAEVDVALEEIVYLLPRTDILSDRFQLAINRHVHDRRIAEHLLHELYTFARSPWTLVEFDRNIVYDGVEERPLTADDDVEVVHEGGASSSASLSASTSRWGAMSESYLRLAAIRERVQMFFERFAREAMTRREFAPPRQPSPAEQTHTRTMDRPSASSATLASWVRERKRSRAQATQREHEAGPVGEFDAILQQLFNQPPSIALSSHPPLPLTTVDIFASDSDEEDEPSTSTGIRERLRRPLRLNDRPSPSLFDATTSSNSSSSGGGGGGGSGGRTWFDSEAARSGGGDRYVTSVVDGSSAHGEDSDVEVVEVLKARRLRTPPLVDLAGDAGDGETNEPKTEEQTAAAAAAAGKEQKSKKKKRHDSSSSSHRHRATKRSRETSSHTKTKTKMKTSNTDDVRIVQQTSPVALRSIESTPVASLSVREDSEDDERKRRKIKSVVFVVGSR